MLLCDSFIVQVESLRLIMGESRDDAEDALPLGRIRMREHDAWLNYRTRSYFTGNLSHEKRREQRSHLNFIQTAEAP